MKSEYITKSAEETRKIGENLAKGLRGQTVMTLTGDLGFGKTTFVQGLAKGLGIKYRIISPTFVIARKYQIAAENAKRNSKTFYHIDLYRLETKEELEGIGMKEILSDPNAIVVIEWPEKLGELLPKKRIDIMFEYLNDSERKIIVSNLNQEPSP